MSVEFRSLGATHLCFSIPQVVPAMKKSIRRLRKINIRYRGVVAFLKLEGSNYIGPMSYQTKAFTFTDL